MGVLENLYSGTSKLFATQFSNKSQRSLQVTSYVTHKTDKKSAIVKGWKHTHLPFHIKFYIGLL
jgi:hypothetical protein